MGWSKQGKQGGWGNGRENKEWIESISCYGNVTELLFWETKVKIYKTVIKLLLLCGVEHRHWAKKKKVPSMYMLTSVGKIWDTLVLISLFAGIPSVSLPFKW